MKLLRIPTLALAGTLMAGCDHVPGAITGTADAPASLPAAPSPPAAPSGNWLRGDTHVHDDHSSDGSFPRQGISQSEPGNLSVAEQIGAGVRNGAQFLPLTDHRTYDQHYDPLWESSQLLLIPGEEANGSPHATVLGAVDSIVQGGERPVGPGFIRLQQSIWDAHAQDASWGTAHPDDGETNDDGSPNANANAQGVDTIEVWNRASTPDAEIDYAENRWNAGFRTGIAGACDDHFKELWLIDGPGTPVTQVFAAQASERGVLDGLRSGRTRIHAQQPLSPDVQLEADMQGDDVFEAIAGDEVIAPAGSKGRLRVTIANGAGTTVTVYKSPGRAAGAWASFQPLSVLTEQTQLFDIETDGSDQWYRVEVRGVGQPAGVDTSTLSDPVANPPSLQTVTDTLLAVTSPIYIGPAPAAARPAVPIPADSGNEDGAALVYGSTGMFAGFPDLALSGPHQHLVVEMHDAAGTHVLYRYAGGGGAAIDLAPASTTARFPKIAALGNEVWVAWQDTRAGETPRRPAIYLRHSGDAGQSWDAEQLVRSLDGRAEHPAIAITRDGHPVLAWQEISAGNPFDVMAQVVGVDAQPVNVSRDGKVIMAATTTDTRSARYPASVWPALAVAPDGSVALAWQDDRTDADPLWTGGTGYGDGTDPDNWQIMVATRAAGTGTWATPASIGADDRADRHPSIAYAADGTLAAAWDSKALQSSGANLEVLAAQSHDGGKTWSAPTAIAPDAIGMGQYPRLGTDGNGAIRAAWYDSRSADWRWRIVTAVLAGDAWTHAQVIASRGNNTWPVINGGLIAFAGTRNARRWQRDRTQQIFILRPPG
ncbi:MAG TPA: CehA/McbA family metallohydrolase [Nevskiaceae bacterium]|nr:CehA/McbA family metallohydrolase [Nevskiaceae bacterium]